MEADLIKNGKHVLGPYGMAPKAGYDYLATTAHLAQTQLEIDGRIHRDALLRMRTACATATARQENAVTHKTLEQSSSYMDLGLAEADLIKDGKHALVSYVVKPKAGYDYLATAAHFAQKSHGVVKVYTTALSVGAQVHSIGPRPK